MSEGCGTGRSLRLRGGCRGAGAQAAQKKQAEANEKALEEAKRQRREALSKLEESESSIKKKLEETNNIERKLKAKIEELAAALNGAKKPAA